MSPAGYVILTMEFKKEGRRWTAQCVELGTATFGRSLEEARRRIGEAMILHLNTLEDVDERERFFAEHHVRLYSQKPKQCKIRVQLPCDGQTLMQSHVQRIPATAVL